MILSVLGINHRQSVPFREALAFRPEAIPQTLQELTADGVLSGALILSTCNRVEIVFTSDTPFGFKRVLDLLSVRSGIPHADLKSALYHYQDEDAIRHVLEVCCGLDSIVLGEPQILEQTKLAYQAAKEAGCLGPILGPFFERVFAVAKRLRTESGIGCGSVSTSRAAVELVREHGAPLSERRVLIIGAGKIATLAARYFDFYGVREMTLANRTLSRAQAVASLFGARAIGLEDLDAALREADVIVSCTSAPGLILTYAQVAQAFAEAPGRRILVDLAVPRDIDPAVQDLEGVLLFNVDMLDKVTDANWAKRRQAAERLRERLEEEVQKCVHHLRVREAGPLIQALRQQAEAIRTEVLQRNRRHLGSLSEEQQAAVDYVTRAILNKLLHTPMRYIKQQADAPESLEMIAQIFGLDQESES